GSEFPIVVLPVVRAYRRMLRKNLLYTAITRSKQSLILCGEMDEFLKGIETLDTNTRYTTLQERLAIKISDTTKAVTNSNVEMNETIEVEQQKSENEEIKLEINPEIEDDGLSPYDFMQCIVTPSKHKLFTLRGSYHVHKKNRSISNRYFSYYCTICISKNYPNFITYIYINNIRFNSFYCCRIA